MRYLKLWTDNSIRPEPAEALADAVLRAAEKRNLLSQWPTIGYTVDNLVDLCKGLSYPRQVPWTDIAPTEQTSDDMVLAQAIVHAAIAHGVTHGDQPLDIAQVLHLADCLTQVGPNDSAYMLPEQIAEAGGVLWLEIQPVIEDEGMCTVIAADDVHTLPNLFTVYTHHTDHLSQSVADFSTPEAAFRFADDIGLAYKNQHGVVLPVHGNLKAWCTAKPDVDHRQGLHHGYGTLTHMRDDAAPYAGADVKAEALKLIEHERKIDGPCVSQWSAQISAHPGAYGATRFSMLAIDAATKADWDSVRSDPDPEHPDCGNLRSVIWIVNPDMTEQAVEAARDLLHYGKTSLPRNQAGLVVSLGERHRIEYVDPAGPVPHFGVAIKVDSRNYVAGAPLRNSDIADLIESAARQVEAGHVGFTASVAGGRLCAVGGVGVLPVSPGPGVVIDIDTSTEAFSTFTKEWEIARILRAAGDRVAAGERDFELQDLNGESVGRLAVVYPPVLEMKQTVALQEFSSPALS